ncbi:Peptidase family M23 [Actinopolyspora lacussalsi subsp. righensis]|uniref:Peptidase family M23 n=1 Tax=Actinopolyspora righensis TaxID=995060 RepID=A0A1I7C8G6_9ACTN|nr:M23 family metallopeptidase [Actinopolyspora righensis]SFT95674.1 Peptidase family M23 [Actinopolyspora righensis]
MRGWAVALVLALGTGTVTASSGPDVPAAPTGEPAGTSTPGFRLRDPLRGSVEVVRGFRKPPNRYGPGHRGVDLRASTGEAVLAAAAGTVEHAGFVVDRHVIAIGHGNGMSTTYEPVLPEVTAGQPVERGEIIGSVTRGHPECAAKKPHTCLHWGLRDHDTYLDPLLRLATGDVRLLPWRGPERVHRSSSVSRLGQFPP